LKKYKEKTKNLSSPLIINVVVGILQDEFFATKCGFGVVLLQDVQLAKLHPARKETSQ